MGIGDVRGTVKQIVNEVQRKLGLDETELSANKLSIQLVDFVNDICNEISDFGNWQEALVSANVTCVSGTIDYSISTSANIKNIGDIYFSLRRGPLRYITVEDMRILTRVTAVGIPTQYTIYGTDANGNPNIRVRPKPAASADGGIFSVLYYAQPPLYTVNDSNVIIPYPADVIVQGVLAKAVLNESGGAPTERYKLTQQDYLTSRKEALNRFNGDTGWSVQFAPTGSRGRRR